MKKQITFLALFVVVTTILFSCKKDETSLKARMMGKWMITKIETSGYTAEETLNDPTKVNGTATYGSTSDYVDFKSNIDDQVELSLNGNRTIGTYVVVYSDQFNMDLNDGLNYAKVNSLTETQLQFTSKIDKTNVTKIYYLTK